MSREDVLRCDMCTIIRPATSALVVDMVASPAIAVFEIKGGTSTALPFEGAAAKVGALAHSAISALIQEGIFSRGDLSKCQKTNEGYR